MFPKYPRVATPDLIRSLRELSDDAMAGVGLPWSWERRFLHCLKNLFQSARQSVPVRRRGFPTAAETQDPTGLGWPIAHRGQHMRCRLAPAAARGARRYG